MDAHLRVADATVFAGAAAAVMVDHDPLADWRLLVGHCRPAFGDDAARLVTADYSPGRTVAIGVQVAAADPRRADRDHHVAWPGHGISEFFERHLTVACEHQPMHAARLSAGFGQARQRGSDQ